MLLAVRDDHALHGAALLHDLGRRRHADASPDGRAQVKLSLNLFFESLPNHVDTGALITII